MGNKVSSQKEENIIYTKDIIQKFVDKLDYEKNYNKNELVNILITTYDEINVVREELLENVDEKKFHEESQQQQLQPQQLQPQQLQQQLLQPQQQQQLLQVQNKQPEKITNSEQEYNNFMNMNLDKDKTILNKLVDDRKRKASDYNIFIGEQIRILKDENPGLSAKDAMKIGAEKWHIFNKKGQDGGGKNNNMYNSAKRTISSLEQRMDNSENKGFRIV